MYITEQRLTNVISHMGIDEAQKKRDKLVGLFVQDVLKDLRVDYGEQYNFLEVKERKFLSKCVFFDCKTLVDNKFTNTC